MVFKCLFFFRCRHLLERSEMGVDLWDGSLEALGVEKAVDFWSKAAAGGLALETRKT